MPGRTEPPPRPPQRRASATGVRGMLADRRLLRWLIGTSLAWLLSDFVYYGNTPSPAR